MPLGPFPNKSRTGLDARAKRTRRRFLLGLAKPSTGCHVSLGPCHSPQYLPVLSFGVYYWLGPGASWLPNSIIILLDSHYCYLGPGPGLGLGDLREKDKVNPFQILSINIKSVSEFRRDKSQHIIETTYEPNSNTEANRKVYKPTCWLCDCGQAT